MAFLALRIINVFAFSIIFFATSYHLIFKKNLSKTFRYSLLTGAILFLVDVIIPTLIVYYYRSHHA